MREFIFHVKYDGAGLCNIDIRNSQPFFLSLLLQAHFRCQPLSSAVAHFIALTSNGTFYEYVTAGMGQPLPGKLPEDAPLVEAQKARARAEFKTSFFSSLFFVVIRTPRTVLRASIFGSIFRLCFDTVPSRFEV